MPASDITSRTESVKYAILLQHAANHEPISRAVHKGGKWGPTAGETHGGRHTYVHPYTSGDNQIFI